MKNKPQKIERTKKIGSLLGEENKRTSSDKLQNKQ